MTLSHMRRILIYGISLEPTVVNPRPTRQDPKAAALVRDGVLNPHPEDVRDPLFDDNPFFDPRDLVQVRYEMVRRHQNDGIAIADVAETFGISRPTFYKAQGALAGQGLAGLVPRQRGPKGGHKISADVLSFVEEVKAMMKDGAHIRFSKSRHSFVLSADSLCPRDERVRPKH